MDTVAVLAEPGKYMSGTTLPETGPGTYPRARVVRHLPNAARERIVVHMTRCWPSLGILTLLLFSGCASAGLGFTDTGFVGKGYSISYVETATYSIVPPDWDLDNYFYNRQGKPHREKDQGIYRDTMDWVDVTGRSERVEYVIYDLKWRHGNGSTFAVCTVAVPPRHSNLRLSAFAEEWANEYSGMQFSFKKGEAHRTASKIVETKARQVGGRAAREVTFDVVDVDQLQLDASAPRTRVRAVFVQAPLVKEFLDSGLRPPAFLFVAYASDERKFDKLVDDYEGLIARIRFDER
jgi:hypothetical protein